MIKKKAFTLAEALTTLTILGVVAALTLPQIIGNFNDHANITAQKAFINDMRNVIQIITVDDGKLNKLKDKGSYETLNEAFVKEKLGSALKFSAMCKDENYAKCGWLEGDDKYNSFDMIGDSGNLNLTSFKNSDFNSNNETNPDEALYAGRVVNGTSVLVSYNPDCEKLSAGDAITKRHLCLNIIYDINGKQIPNQVGRDIGVISVFSSRRPIIAAPIPYEGGEFSGNMSYTAAKEECNNLAKGKADLPTEEEAVSMIINRGIIRGEAMYGWSSMLNRKAKNATNHFVCVHSN